MSKGPTKRMNIETARQSLAEEELPPKKELSVPQRLKSIVTRLLGGPGGDPDPHHCLAAAHTVLLAGQLGYPDLFEEEIVRDLRAGLGDVDYIDLAERDALI